jgi:hypothetical protein|tara:strand:+ start:1386 stop:1514 length:129 start_codon:yes stop_codon:yes gene_type:complete
MIKFVVGVVVGIFIATAGVAGIFKVIDKGVSTVKETSQELSK